MGQTAMASLISCCCSGLKLPALFVHAAGTPGQRDQEHLGHDDDGYQSYCTVCCHKAMGCCCCVAMQYRVCQHPGDIR
ncbi:hypothetical protein UY3_14646 [Chelonia mydas]|uniref:Secreted protein n=1 Tax=Chelonia mydas TaxID=8469 RepID=M7B7V8_CHEMY|nr:hypothetical protein UY3_14646 [Chelonia mydas]